MEFLLGVDLVLASWSVIVDTFVVPVLDGALGAESTVLTVAVVVTIDWG